MIDDGSEEGGWGMQRRGRLSPSHTQGTSVCLFIVKSINHGLVLTWRLYRDAARKLTRVNNNDESIFHFWDEITTEEIFFFSSHSVGGRTKTFYPAGILNLGQTELVQLSYSEAWSCIAWQKAFLFFQHLVLFFFFPIELLHLCTHTWLRRRISSNRSAYV